ncbi:beta-ketoacyl synthase N-terminal-like domain-containing protein [Nocardia brasiliensis]|uniref:beta-ketoacyl synthase N-terminal-like domain-containing protein n=1 Tax=Nocardia brasiliensis TaxID=37326 RepID=UPI003D914A7D
MGSALEPPPFAVAIIGMAGRFPDAEDVDTLWRNLLVGRTAVRRHDPMAAESHAAAATTMAEPVAASVLADAQCFDADFFGVDPAEALITDPQHRLFLECVWSALESAGYDPGACGAATGLFAGSCFPTYLLGLLAQRPDLVAAHGLMPITVANDCDSLTSWVSYKLNLRGPALTVRTFSSSSLVAVHQAAQSLLTGECDMAVAGAAAVKFPQVIAYPGVTSPTGVCRALDAGADGSVVGNAVAAVVLKRAADAIRDGDHVHALILGSATNTDGARRASYTAPGVAGKTAVVAEALANADVAASSLGYIEAHAMGTKLGDEVEMAALARVFGTDKATQPCVVGAIAANLGHLDAASGIAGLIKTALVLEHGRLVPQPNFRAPNAALRACAQLEASATGGAWQRPGPRRAGVSSFGLGGVNAHVVLQEPPALPVRTASDEPHLVVLSARTPAGLAKTTGRLREWLDRRPGISVPDLAFTLRTGRPQWRHRRAIVASTRDELLSALTDVAAASNGVVDGPRAQLAARGAEWVAGEHVTLDDLAGHSPARRIPLPTYPFERTSFGLCASGGAPGESNHPSATAPIDRKRYV